MKDLQTITLLLFQTTLTDNNNSMTTAFTVESTTYKLKYLNQPSANILNTSYAMRFALFSRNLKGATTVRFINFWQNSTVL